MLAVLFVGCGRIGFDLTVVNCMDTPKGCVDAAVPVDRIPINVSTSPTRVSGDAACRTTSNSNRSVALDASNHVYVVYQCNGILRGVTSGDGGVTFSIPVDLGVTQVESIAVSGGRSGVAYVAVTTTMAVEFLKTLDYGETWSTRTLGAATTGNWGVSLAAHGNSVYVAVQDDEIHVYTNQGQAEGFFTEVAVALPAIYGDLLIEPESGELFLVADTPALRIRKSVNLGASFEAAVGPMASYSYSNWTLANSTIFVTGAENSFTRIPIAAIDTSESTSFDSVVPQGGRSLAAALDGSLFIAEAGAQEGSRLTRYPVGSDVGTSLILPVSMSSSVVAASSEAAVYMFVNPAGEVHVGVEVF